MFVLNVLLQVKELNHVLEAEKSCRTDLEMYVAVLNTQKSVLQEDAEKLRKELHDGIQVSLHLNSFEASRNSNIRIRSFVISHKLFRAADAEHTVVPCDQALCQSLCIFCIFSCCEVLTHKHSQSLIHACASDVLGINTHSYYVLLSCLCLCKANRNWV